MIKINENVTLDENELEFQFVRGSGPGGQNVNKLSTKVLLFFDIDGSGALSDAQKSILKAKLKTRLSKDGIFQLASHKYRSQLANREDVVIRFAEIIRKALTRRPRRIKTKIPKIAREKRLEEKKKQSYKKELRRKDIDLH